MKVKLDELTNFVYQLTCVPSSEHTIVGTEARDQKTGIPVGVWEVLETEFAPPGSANSLFSAEAPVYVSIDKSQHDRCTLLAHRTTNDNAAIVLSGVSISLSLAMNCQVIFGACRCRNGVRCTGGLGPDSSTKRQRLTKMIYPLFYGIRRVRGERFKGITKYRHFWYC